MNEAFRENDDKYREWAIEETREKKVTMAVMVPLIISHDGAVHKDIVKRWKDFAPDILAEWVWMARSILRYNFVIVGKVFNKGSWVSEAWRKNTQKNSQTRPVDLRNESRRQQSEETA